MTALWLEPTPRSTRPRRSGEAPDLRLVSPDAGSRSAELALPQWEEPYELRLVEEPRRAIRSTSRRRPSVAVRRRRTILAAMGLVVVGLALPLSGTGGDSHTTGSASAEIGHSATYTVRSGDTLWTIAERADPSADPRPLVAKMAAETGSENVQPGERIVVP